MANRECAKHFWRGTHRTAPPHETMRRFGGFASALGITRIANVTGLDYLGIPVFMAVRPNARSLSVAQGKGLDEAAARASAFMEAAEICHAEQAAPELRVASYAQLKRQARAADPRALPLANGRSLSLNSEWEWVEGTDLQTGTGVFVPFDLVHTRFDHSRRAQASPFHRSSNGLASGNVWLEAVVAGLCETIERDALGIWEQRSAADKAARRLRLRSVTDGDCRTLLDSLADRQMKIALWDITTDIGVAAFLCRLGEDLDNVRSALGPFWGAGCHLSREVALARAITEAAQSRLTCIVGSRDDLRPRDYDRTNKEELSTLLVDDWEEHHATRRFADVPSTAGRSFDSDLTQILKRLQFAGLKQSIAVDLTDPRFEIPVVRIVVPGLETYNRHQHHKPGRRARALARAQ